MKKTLRVIGLCLLALYVVYTLYYLWQQSQPARHRATGRIPICRYSRQALLDAGRRQA